MLFKAMEVDTITWGKFGTLKLWGTAGRTSRSNFVGIEIKNYSRTCIVMEAKGRESLIKEESSVLNATERLKEMRKTSKWLRRVILNQFLRKEFFLEQHNDVMSLSTSLIFILKKNVRFNKSNLSTEYEKNKI